MRALTKRAEPTCLTNDRARWTAEYLAAAEAGKPTPSPWRHKDVVSTLIAETYGKCAYCEANIADVAYPHIDHIVPKSVRPDLVVEWLNLTVSCPVCNTNKADYFDDGLPLVNPYIDDPTEFFAFIGPMLVARMGNLRARRTIRQLRLHRPGLIISQMQSIELVHELIDRWHESQEPGRSVLADEIRDRVGADREFASCLSAYVETLGFAV